MATWSAQFDTKILRIKTWVLFRPTLLNGPKKQIGLSIINLEDGCSYELTGRSALLWLLIDGVTPINKLIKRCKSIAKIKDPRYSSLALKGFDDLLKLNLVMEVSGRQIDERVQDMKVFMREIKRGKIKKSSYKGEIKIQPEAGERATLREVQNRFLKFLKSNTRLKVVRLSPPFTNVRLHVFMSELSWPNKQDYVPGLGAGLTVEAAAISAVGEGIERLSSFDFTPDILSKSFNDLVKSGHNPLDPESYQFYDPRQNAIKNKEVINLSRETLAHWMYFENVESPKKKILVPGDIARHQKNLLLPRIFQRSGSGCAGHTDRDKAKLNAVFELIERDHVLFYWRTRNTPALIDPHSLPRKLQDLLLSLGGLGNRIKLFYLKSELSVVTVQAVLVGEISRGEPKFIHTAATRTTAEEAIEKSLIELLYVLSGYVKTSHGQISYGTFYDNSIWDFEDRINLYGSLPETSAYNFLFPKEPLVIKTADIAGKDFGSPSQNLEALIKDFRQNDLRLYFRDTTSRQIKNGFFVYRSYSPDLIALDQHHRFRPLGYPRYYKLPGILGLRRKPKYFWQLNSWPHPIS